MSRAGGFCPLIAGEPKTLYIHYIYILLPTVCLITDRLPFSEDRVWDRVPRFCPLLMKGQSLQHICVNHVDEIVLNERSLYNYVDDGIFTARNIDIPCVVRMGKRKKEDSFKVDKKCRIGHTYQDLLEFMTDNPGLPIVEMGSVEGKKGGKVLLTLHFTAPQLMLAFIRNANTSQSVLDIFNRLYLELNPDIFRELFKVLLGDNGSEFSNPSAIDRFAG